MRALIIRLATMILLHKRRTVLLAFVMASIVGKPDAIKVPHRLQVRPPLVGSILTLANTWDNSRSPALVQLSSTH